MRITFLIAAGMTALAVAGYPVAAEAVGILQCKGVASGAGPSEDTAVSAWTSQVSSQYGSAWADFSLARDKQYSDNNLVLGQLDIVTAEPCKRVQVVTSIGVNQGVLKLQPSLPRPSPHPRPFPINSGLHVLGHPAMHLR